MLGEDYLIYERFSINVVSIWLRIELIFLIGFSELCSKLCLFAFTGFLLLDDVI